MKRYLALALVCLATILLVAPHTIAGTAKNSVAAPGPPSPPSPVVTSVQNTNWKGDIVFMETSGRTQTETGALLAIGTQTNSFFSGTFTTSTGSVPFSGLVNPCGPADLQITVTDMLIRACIIKSPKSTTAAVMNITGSDLATGKSFSGQLTQQ